MGEENQNVVQNTISGTGNVVEQPVSLREQAESMNARKEQIRKNVLNYWRTNAQQQLDTMHQSALTSNNNEICQTTDRECKKGEFAYFLKEKLASDGYDGLENVDNNMLLNTYINNTQNPQLTYNIIKDYVTHGEEKDITPYLVRLGWIEPTEEEKTANWFERFGASLWGAYEQAGRGLRNFTSAAAKTVGDTDGVTEAMQEYAYDKYGRNHPFSKITDEERAEIDRDYRIDPSILDPYLGEQRMDYAAADIVGGGAMATMETLAFMNPFGAGMVLGLAGLSATPYVDVIPEGLGAIVSGIGEIPYDIVLQTTRLLAPDVYNYLNSFPEEKKQSLFMLGGGALLGSYFKSHSAEGYKYAGGGLWNKMKNFFKKPGTQLKVISDIEKFEQGLNRQKNELSVKNDGALKEMNRKSNRIVNSETVAENTDISNALAKLDKDSLKKIKTYEELFNLNEKRVKQIENYQNTIADSIDKKWGPENDIWDVKVRNGDYIGNGKPNTPIKEFIDKMKLMTKDSDPVTRKAIDTIEQKYYNNDITARDITNFKRILSRQFELYRYGKEGVELKVSKNDIETTRRGLNKLLRDEVEGIPEFKDIGIGNVFEWTDSEFSPSLHLRGRLVDLVNEVNELQGQIPADARKGELGKDAGKVTSLKGWLDIISGWLGGKGKGKMTNALDYQEKLNMHLKDFIKLTKGLSNEQSKMIESTLLNYLKRKVSGPEKIYGGNLGEGEVIDGGIFGKDFGWEEEIKRNKYLEDYVEIVEPDAPGYNTLEENVSYNGQDPIDYSTPTRVTPEGYAGRRGQTIESYKNLLKESGFTDEQAAAVLEVLEKNGFKLKAGDQPSIFPDMPSLEEIKSQTKSKKSKK